MKRRKMLLGLMSALLVFAMVGCSSAKTEEPSNSNAGTTGTTATGKDIKGDITVITQKTDIVDTVFKDYATKFKQEYPNINVKFQALSDYEGQIKVRMNSSDYGDVLLLPTSVPLADLPQFFEPLGNFEDLSKQYTGLEERTVDGKVYGIPTAINYSGLVYNKKVFADAGVTEVPKTPDQFLAALQKIKDKGAAVPLYTNYAAGWTLTQWEAALTTVAGNVDYVNVTQPNTDDNFVKGQPHYELYKVMFDAAQKGLIEKDPTTTDWESSKADLANGKIGTMVLGSWAVGQVKALSKTPDDIGFMPFPTNAEKVIVPLSDDYTVGVSSKSSNKEAAKAWVDWFINKSGYPTTEGAGGGMSPAVGAELPEVLKQFEGTGVEFKFQTPAKAGQEGLVDKIDKDSEIGLWQPDFKKRIIEAAIGNKKESFDDIMKDLNDRWKASRASVASE
ncbi:ABC transporter substrate-binding protein [Paenibacillus sp. YPG26]|uniref:ABC transporter substrate-binding protein n=1 Tax=Paenibacillus sp. YPG26 TaxID=2878915 RepID=UPI00203F74C3|nr:ABC transporter substrate-binding protein [Paenibacillus sp. YPG26]USB32356.1 ABC transporter substrate-binding protein [Paenibacillus sp. YPG26]